MPQDGVLIVDKPAGLTSRQVVSRVASLAGVSKAGHSGTLDPLATGVLVVCLGRATLLTRYLGFGQKEYVAEALLGVETDTYDIDGEVVSAHDASDITKEDVGSAIATLATLDKQAPPPYSAVKHNGRPLYQYARAGVHVSTLERAVRVDSIDLVEFGAGVDDPFAVLDITCGPGTYVRSLIHDLGHLLGCGACVSRLRRTRSGQFSIEDAVSLEDVDIQRPDSVSDAAISIEDATSTMPTVRVSMEQARAVAMGKPIMAGVIDAPVSDEVFRVLDPRGSLIALYGPARPDDEGIDARAVRVLRPWQVDDRARSCDGGVVESDVAEGNSRS